jgi:hypothetical protein
MAEAGELFRNTYSYKYKWNCTDGQGKIMYANPRSHKPRPSFFDLRAGSGALFCTGLVPIAYYTLIDKGFKPVQVFRS